jgi:NADH-quinone oxidoreductase subunit J
VNIDQVVFGIMFIMALGSSLAMLFAPNAVHTALFLVAAQIALALAFLLQGAFFVAVIQIILYAGAIMVLFLFVIMLLGVDRREALIEPLRFQRPLAVGLGVLLVAEILWLTYKGIAYVAGGADGSDALNQINRNPGNVRALAEALFGSYLLPFEITSVLLVAAIVGVMVLSRRIGALSALTGHEARAADREAA